MRTGELEITHVVPAWAVKEIRSRYLSNAIAGSGVDCIQLSVSSVPLTLGLLKQVNVWLEGPMDILKKIDAEQRGGKEAVR